MKRLLSFTLCAGLAATLAMTSFADGLIQTHKVRLAPGAFNDIGPAPNNTITTTDHNEYPWFTEDGKLFLWTRQINPNRTHSGSGRLI